MTANFQPMAFTPSTWPLFSVLRTDFLARQAEGENFENGTGRHCLPPLHVKPELHRVPQPSNL